MSTLASTSVAPRRRRSLAARIWAAYELGRSRAQLRALPDYLLEDVGISRSEAKRESERPAWDVPAWWRG